MDTIAVSQRILVSFGKLLSLTDETMENQIEKIGHITKCHRCLGGVRDALYVLNGKWKLLILGALREGPQRFNELQRLVKGITPKLLAKELRELELNEFILRRVYASQPVLIEYELTAYGTSLDEVIETLGDWGMQHRARIQSHGRAD